VVLASNVVSATTSFANLTGLSWAIAANTRQEVECHLQFNTNATTTGIGVSWTGPSSPTQAFGHLIASLTTTTPGMTTIVGNDTGVATTGVPATTNNVARFNGTWRNGANAGTIQMRLRSEVAVSNGVTVIAGSWCKYAVF
jgi:hypothetical protein